MMTKEILRTGLAGDGGRPRVRTSGSPRFASGGLITGTRFGLFFSPLSGHPERKPAGPAGRVSPTPPGVILCEDENSGARRTVEGGSNAAQSRRDSTFSPGPSTARPLSGRSDQENNLIGGVIRSPRGDGGARYSPDRASGRNFARTRTLPARQVAAVDGVLWCGTPCESFERHVRRVLRWKGAIISSVFSISAASFSGPSRAPRDAHRSPRSSWQDPGRLENCDWSRRFFLRFGYATRAFPRPPQLDSWSDDRLNLLFKRSTMSKPENPSFSSLNFCACFRDLRPRAFASFRVLPFDLVSLT